MASINIRIDEDLKDRAYAKLETLGVTPSEVIRQTLEYIASSGKLPFQSEVLTNNEADLIALVRQRLSKPLPPIEINIDEL